MINSRPYRCTYAPRTPCKIGSAVSALVFGMVCSETAIAQVNLAQGQGYDPFSELITETVARRELNRDYYIQKQRGATTVSDQNRQFAAPEGLHVGPFFAFPSASVISTFDDNIFRSNTNKQSDLKTVLAPSLAIHSDLPRHKLDFSLNGRIVTFLDNSDQNHEDYNAALRGALHFDHAHTLSATLITGLAHEERGAQTTPLSAAEPVPVFRHRASIGITRDVGRLHGTLSARVERLDFQDVKARNGGNLDQDHRDVDAIGTRLQVGYRISPGFELLGSVSGNRLDNKGTGIQDFDGNHFDIRGGVGFEIGPLLNFELLGGYGMRDFDAPDKETVTTTVFGGQLEWLPTRRTTVTGRVTRNVSDHPDANGGTFINTRIGASVDHEIYHNVIARGGLSYTNSEFTDSNREDDIFSAGLGVRYLYTKNMHFSAGYEYVQRDSTDPNFTATNNRFTVGAKLQF